MSDDGVLSRMVYNGEAMTYALLNDFFTQLSDRHLTPYVRAFYVIDEPDDNNVDDATVCYLLLLLLNYIVPVCIFCDR